MMVVERILLDGGTAHRRISMERFTSCHRLFDAIQKDRNGLKCDRDRPHKRRGECGVGEEPPRPRAGRGSLRGEYARRTWKRSRTGARCRRLPGRVPGCHREGEARGRSIPALRGLAVELVTSEGGRDTLSISC